MKRVAMLLLLLPFSSASAEPIGRLFFTPEQRATMDNARRQKIKIDVETEAPVMENISVNGVVKRSDGESIVWINNRPIRNRQAPGGFKITPTDSARVNVQLPQSNRSVDMKVGQSLNAASGRIAESYQIPALTAVPEKKITATEKPQPAAPSEKIKSRISSKADEEAVREPSAPDNEQPASPSPPQTPVTVQY
ncbi:MAG: hypothetical protein ACREUY_01840 [Burkholderiales bacterium]